MVETLAELPFIGDQVVCLNHDQGRPQPAQDRLHGALPLSLEFCGEFATQPTAAPRPPVNRRWGETTRPATAGALGQTIRRFGDGELRQEGARWLRCGRDR